MKAAFPIEEAEEDYGGPVWQDNEDTSVDLINTERISCFAHTLQLVVGDALKDTKAISLAVAKATKVSSMLHKSTSYKVR